MLRVLACLCLLVALIARPAHAVSYAYITCVVTNGQGGYFTGAVITIDNTSYRATTHPGGEA